MPQANASMAGELHNLTEGAFLFTAPQGNILFGCPPEILKRIMSAQLPMADVVVLPEVLHFGHSSQASLEFPLYHFLFVQRGLERGRQFQVLATQTQCQRLEDMLRITVMGPTQQEMLDAGVSADVAQYLIQETEHLCLKNPSTGVPFPIDEMLNFRALETQTEVEVFPASSSCPAVMVKRQGPAQFVVRQGDDAFEMDLSVSSPQAPIYTVQHSPFKADPGQFSVAILGRSNGFDPKDPSNGYLLNLNGKLALWDCPAYTHWHLDRMGVDPNAIEALVLSHVHEDHLDVTESIRQPKPFDLYATAEVYFSLLVKLQAVYGCSLEEAKTYHYWKPIEPHQPSTILGAEWTFFHAVHAIPAIGTRVALEVNGQKGLLHISGDHLANAAMNDMQAKGGLSDARLKEMRGLLNGEETLVLMDAGGGTIHGDFHDYLDYKGRMAYMHTGLIQEALPEGHQLVRSGQILNVFAD